MTTASWAVDDHGIGSSVPGSVDALTTTQSGVTIGPVVPVGTLRKFRDVTGVYGEVTCIYLPGVASLTVGDVVSYDISAGVKAYTDATVVRWAGTANTGYPLAIASAANTSSSTFSWYFVQGAAPVNCSGTVAAGDSAYFNATAQVKSAGVNGKQILGMKASSANGVPATGQAVYTLDFPAVQSQIT